MGELAQRERDRAQSVAPILAAVAGDQQSRHSAVAKAGRRKPGPRLHDRIDAGVAGDEDRSGDSFLAEIGGGEDRRREQQVGVGVDRGAILLFRPGHRRVMASKPGFDMRDRDCGDTSRERSAERARRVALDDQQVRRLAQLRQDRRGDALDVRMRVLRPRAVQPGRRVSAKAMIGGVEVDMLAGEDQARPYIASRKRSGRRGQA